MSCADRPERAAFGSWFIMSYQRAKASSISCYISIYISTTHTIGCVQGVLGTATSSRAVPARVARTATSLGTSAQLKAMSASLFDVEILALSVYVYLVGVSSWQRTDWRPKLPRHNNHTPCSAGEAFAVNIYTSEFESFICRLRRS